MLNSPTMSPHMKLDLPWSSNLKNIKVLSLRLFVSVLLFIAELMGYTAWHKRLKVYHGFFPYNNESLISSKE